MRKTQNPSTIECREIPGFPGYYVGSDGSVWSKHDPAGQGIVETKHRLEEWVESKHLRVCLFRNSKRHYIFVHRLVLLAFRGPCPEGLIACHNDSNGFNNFLENLRWDTHQSNADDMMKRGTQNRGVRQHLAKLNDEKVREIRRLATQGLGPRVLAMRYGVGRDTIARAITGRTWKHVRGEAVS